MVVDLGRHGVEGGGVEVMPFMIREAGKGREEGGKEG